MQALLVQQGLASTLNGEDKMRDSIAKEEDKTIICTKGQGIAEE